MVKILNYEVPEDLIENYVKAQIMADSYLLGKLKTPSGTDYELNARWQLCVRECMKIHREICSLLKIKYSSQDDFYKAFHKEIMKRTQLKG